MTPNKDLRKLIRNLERSGLEVTKHGKHLKIKNPKDNTQVTISSTPQRGSRTWLNIQSDLKRVGYDAKQHQ